MGGGPLDLNTVGGWFTLIAPFASILIFWVWFEWYFRPKPKVKGDLDDLVQQFFTATVVKPLVQAHMVEEAEREAAFQKRMAAAQGTVSSTDYIQIALSRVNAAPPVICLIANVLTDYAAKPDRMEPAALQKQLSMSVSVLPTAKLIKGAYLAENHGVNTWDAYRAAALSKHNPKSDEYITYQSMYRLPIPELGRIAVRLQIPRNLRTQHTHVIASTGFGKSQLFTSLILEDLEHDHAIVVIDSQNDLINSLATRIPADRLLLVDPIFCPPVINLMAMDDDAVGLSLIEYMFNTHDAPLTSQQKMVFRFVGRLVLASDKPHIAALMVLLRKPDAVLSHYSHVLAKQSTATKEFFEDFCASKSQYKETREQLSRRVLTMLENDVFQTMMAAEDPRLNITRAIAEKKVILVNTAKSEMGEAATIFGRFWLAQVLRTVTKVPEGQRTPVHVYVDEFQDYAEDSPIIAGAFEQGRKYGLAMTVAHQSLSQLPDKLQASLMSNCAIRLAGGVSADDRARIAKQMDVEPEFVSRTSKGNFAAWFRDMGTYYYPVEFGQLKMVSEIAPLSTIQDRMRKLYGPTKPRPDQQTPPGQAKTKPRNDDDVDGPAMWE